MTIQNKQIKTEIQDFFKQHGRYPKTTELDQMSFSVKTIQRRWGGIANMYKDLGIEYRQNYRGEVWKDIRKQSLMFEKEFYDLLCTKYDPKGIHPQRPYLWDEEHRCDFYLWDEDLWIDCINSENTKHINKCVEIKRKKYNHFSHATKMRMRYVTPDFVLKNLY